VRLPEIRKQISRARQTMSALNPPKGTSLVAVLNTSQVDPIWLEGASPALVAHPKLFSDSQQFSRLKELAAELTAARRRL